eukprot:jgi/Botrbrau1/20847/Bobra.0156s0072.1
MAPLTLEWRCATPSLERAPPDGCPPHSTCGVPTWCLGIHGTGPMVGTVYLVYFGTRDGVGCLPRYVWHEASYRFDALNSGFCIQGWELKYTWRATAVCLTSTWDVGLKYRSDLEPLAMGYLGALGYGLLGTLGYGLLGTLGYGLLGILGWISFYVLYVYLMCTVCVQYGQCIIKKLCCMDSHFRKAL